MFENLLIAQASESVQGLLILYAICYSAQVDEDFEAACISSVFAATRQARLALASSPQLK